MAFGFFRNDIGVLLRLQRTIVFDTFRYMKYSVTPMLFMLIPVIVVMIQLNLRFALRPLEPGETTLFKVHVGDADTIGEGVTIEVPEGIALETPAVRIPSKREVAWRIRADEPGQYVVRVTAGGDTVEKEVVIGTAWTAVSPSRFARDPLNNLLYPGEHPIPGDSSVETITVNYPELDITVFGFAINWLVLFFVLSIRIRIRLQRRDGCGGLTQPLKRTADPTLCT